MEFRFHHPDSVAEQLLQQGRVRVRFDLERLERHMSDPDAYGRVLSGSLFVPPVKDAFDRARSLAQSDDLGLRVRLLIGPSAPQLHGVRWETLRDPRDGTPLLMDEAILFSRYLSSMDWRPVGVRPRSELRALVVVADPSGLAEYEAQGRALPPIDVGEEVERARRAMVWRPTVLASGGAATLAGILDGLREGHDILYLVCHAYLVEGEPQLLLEDPDGKVHRVSGGELIDALRDLARPPRLVVLASCQSAGSGGEASSSDDLRSVVLASRQSAGGGGEESSSDDRGALASLGPRMAEAGVPAVLAMQGRVSMRTVSEFMPVFFAELGRDGQLDRAMAVARRMVRDRHDWWVPVLFTRLATGRFWYAPGFAGERDFEQWPSLIAQIRRGCCTPVLGSGLTDGYIGSRQEIAQGWARQYHFPMARHRRGDMPHVAQYLAVNQSYDFPRYELRDYVGRELMKRYGKHLPPGASGRPVDELILAAGAYRRSVDPGEPHAVLARLPFKMFVTTPAQDLLVDALIAEGKKPQVELCRWNDDASWPPSVFDDPTSRYEPSVQRPLVYHLFGSFRHPYTMVITEDDYFDFLIGVTKNRELIPETVRRALADSALLFLGFRLDQWDFAVLFRSILSQQASRWRRYTHVAAQIDPEEASVIDPNRARRYLESYFSRHDQIRISIYWGSADDFARELRDRWPESSR
ncbi:MAG: CHAT domain-containing protein [Egibacteraceae bacterium]